MFSCEYYEIFKNTYFVEHLQTATSAQNVHVLCKYNTKVKTWCLRVFSFVIFNIACFLKFKNINVIAFALFHSCQPLPKNKQIYLNIGCFSYHLVNQWEKLYVDEKSKTALPLFQIRSEWLLSGWKQWEYFQLTFTRSNSTTETLEKGVKYVQS